MAVRARPLEARVRSLHRELMQRFARAGIPRAGVTGHGDYRSAMRQVLTGFRRDLGLEEMETEALDESVEM